MDSDTASEQEDELYALSEIYPSTSFKRVPGEPAGKFSLSPDLTNELTILFDESVKSLPVRHLPPFNLTFHLPADYPSKSPPSYSLSCSWLTRSKLSMLRAHLDSMWLPDTGVVLFSWAQFLIDESLAFLDIITNCAGSLSMLAKNTSDEGRDCLDDRASQNDKSLAQLRAALHTYDREQCACVFASTYHDCEVCYSSLPGTQCVEFNQCRHSFCYDCVRSYFSMQVKDGAVTSMCCLAPDCESEAFPNQVRKLLSEELYEKYERLLLNRALESIEEIVICPVRVCQKPVVIDGGSSNLARCAACELSFCVLCRRTWHGTNPCHIDKEKRAELLKAYTEGSADEKAALRKRYGSTLEKYLDESLSEQWLEENSKACPSCGFHIQKTEGCNKMTCTRCRRQFCWMCSIILKNHDPYQHFSDKNSECYLRLFDGVEEDMEDDEWAVH